MTLPSGPQYLEGSAKTDPTLDKQLPQAQETPQSPDYPFYCQKMTAKS